MNRNNNSNFFNDLNISNTSEKELNDILTEDLLTYSEDKSQSIINIHQMPYNNDNITMNDHNQSLKNLIPKKEKEYNFGINNNEISQNRQFKNKNGKKIKNGELKQNDIKIIIDDINNGNNKDLSSLQISLSNLLSDIDSKETIIYQNNKINDNSNSNENNNNLNKVGIKKENSIQQNYLIDISNENANSSISNNYNNNNINIINSKNKIIQNEEQSSACSLCNYSQSLYINSKKPNNNFININNNINNKIKKNFFTIDNNYIIDSNIDKNSKEKNVKLNKEKNINIFINSKEKQSPNNKNKKLTKRVLNELKRNNQKNKNNASFKNKYKIEKGENIQLSIISNLNNFYLENSLNYYNNSLSINKQNNFTINNTSISNTHLNDYYSIINNNANTASLEIIKEQTKLNKQNGIFKNKIKLINNKNIDIQKEESKKFFYNPKLISNTNQIKNINKENNSLKRFKNYGNNRTELSDNYIETFHNNKDKNLILNKFDNKKNNKNIDKINHISYHLKNPKNSNSYNKNIKKENSIQKTKKLYYINKNRKTISSYNNSHNNSCNKKNQFMKLKIITRNIESSDIVSKNNAYVTFHKKGNSISKSKSKNNKNKKMQLITEPSKFNNRKNFFDDSNKNVNIITNEFMNQIKSEQKKTKNKLLNKLNNLNNLNTNINIINKASIFPIFSNTYEKKLDNSSDKKKIQNKNEQYKNFSNSKKNKLKPIEKTKSKPKPNKLNCFTEDINIIKQKKQNNKDNSHKKIKTQINLATLLNNFNRKERTKKNNKSLYNFGNIFFINQSQITKKVDSDIINEKSENNKGKILIMNDNSESIKLNTLNYSSIKHRPQIINDFSNYKKKINSNKNNNDIDCNLIKNNEALFKQKRISTDIDLNKHSINMKNKIRDSFKLRKAEGDYGNDIIKEV